MFSWLRCTMSSEGAPSKENVVFYGASTPKAKENKKEKRKNNKLFCLFLLMVQVVEVLNLIMSWILQDYTQLSLNQMGALLWYLLVVKAQPSEENMVFYGLFSFLHSFLFANKAPVFPSFLLFRCLFLFFVIIQNRPSSLYLLVRTRKTSHGNWRRRRRITQVFFVISYQLDRELQW